MESDILFAGAEWIIAGGLLLVLIGFSFLILEFFLPSFGLFGFAGGASILIGVVQLHQSGYIDNMPLSVEALIMMAIIGLCLSAAGGVYSYRLFKRKSTTGIESMVGETATVIEWSGKTGRIHVQGEDWQAYADEDITLHKNTRVIVARVDGLKIKVITDTNMGE